MFLCREPRGGNGDGGVTGKGKETFNKLKFCRLIFILEVYFYLHENRNMSDPNYCSLNNVTYKAQCGFQKGISTGHAILDIVTNSFDNINHNLCTGLIFLDPCKTFVRPNVSHDILLRKLNHNDIRDPVLQLKQSFLFFCDCFIYLNTLPVIQ